MKLNNVLTLVFLVAFLTPITSASAQQTAFDIYTTNYSQYRDAHESYEKTKNAYKQFGTLKSKTDAEVATKSMLILRSQTVISYLKLVHEQIGGPNDYNSAHLAFIDQEIGWYSSNLEALNSFSSLEDLVKASSGFQDRYNKETRPKIPLAINLVNYSIVNGYLQNAESEIVTLAQKVPTLPRNLPIPQIEKNLTDAKTTLLEAAGLASEIKAIQNQTRSPLLTANRLTESQKKAKNVLLKTYSYVIEIEKQIYP